MADIGDWFKSLPQLTKYWFGGTVALSLVARFGIISPYYLILQYQEVFHSFQIWRLITALLFYPISPQTGFHFLINLYFLVNYSKLLETGVFATRPADYAFLLLFNWIACLVAGFGMNMMVLMDPMVLSVLYVWCNLNRDTIVNFWFGTQFRAMYLPWVLFGFNLILSGGGMAELIGIIVGHLYFFLKFEYPDQYGGPALLQTPAFLESYFPPRVGGMAGMGGFMAAPPGRPAGPGAGGAGGGSATGGGGGGGGGGFAGRFGGHNWGRGQALGQ